MGSLKVLEHGYCPRLDLAGQHQAPAFCSFQHEVLLFKRKEPVPRLAPQPSASPGGAVGVTGAAGQSLKSPLARRKVFETGIGLLSELVEFPFNSPEQSLELGRVQTWAVVWTQ